MKRAAIVAVAGIAIVVAALAVLGPRACSRAQQQTAAVEVTSARESGVAEAAIEAAAITANTMSAASEIDATTRENERAIRSTPGADAPVAAAVNTAGIRALCLRQAGARDPRCAALLAARRQPAH